MPTIIPIDPGVPEQLIAITLDNEPIVLRVRWNGVAQLWHLDLWERDGTTPIAFGLPVTMGERIGAEVRHPIFLGALIVIDDGAGTDPGFSDLGRRCHLIHCTAADLVLMGLPR